MLVIATGHDGENPHQHRVVVGPVLSLHAACVGLAPVTVVRAHINTESLLDLCCPSKQF